MMSSTIASNGCSWARQSPSLPSWATSTTKPSASSPRRSVSASGRSSSTTRTRIRSSSGWRAGQVVALQLSPGGDAELGEDVVEAVRDGPRAQEQLRADLPVGQPSRGAVGDLALLRGELLEGARVTLAGALPAGPQLGAGTLGPGGRRQPVEDLQGGPQVRAGVAAAPAAAQPLAVAQLGTGELEGPQALLAAAVRGQRGLEAALGDGVVGAQQAAAAPRQMDRPWLLVVPGPRLELVQDGHGR